MPRILVIALCAGLLAACSSGGSTDATTPVPSPAATTRPTKDLTYTSGSAEVTVTGDQQASFTAPLDSSRGATFEKDGGFDVWWRSGNQALNVSGDVKSGQVDAFVRVETGTGDEHAYVDSFHNICDITVTEYSDTSLAGTFDCRGLPSWAGKTKVDATGTFRAAA